MIPFYDRLYGSVDAKLGFSMLCSCSLLILGFVSEFVIVGDSFNDEKEGEIGDCSNRGDFIGSILPEGVGIIEGGCSSNVFRLFSMGGEGTSNDGLEN